MSKSENRWLSQYLVEEKMFYLVEIHDEYGVISEHFFDTYCLYHKYVSKNKIIVKSK